MRADEFVASRRDEWNQLENLIARGSSGRLNPLQPMQVLALTALYRRATADLARAQRDWPGQPVHLYLNGLVARGHGVIYRRGGDVWKRLKTFYAETLPRTYRQSWPYLTAAAALFWIPALVAFFVVLANPDAAYGLASPDLVDQVKQHHLWTQIPPDQRIEAAGAIMTNNIYVVFIAFGFGVIFGLPVIYVMIQNGVLLGGLFGLTQAYGISGGLFDFVIAHGVLELSIVIAIGGGGLMMGWSLVSPGNRKRSDALVTATLRAFILVLGLAPLLIVAGTIEGNISPSDVPFTAKLLIGLTTGGLLYSYLLLVGRPRRRRAADLRDQSSARSLSSR